MKKLVFAIALLFGSFATFAATVSGLNLENPIVLSQEKFKEIKAEEVPDAVKMAMKKDYPEATLDKAYVNEKKEYKLEITVATQKTTVYADADGNWITK
jgi:hypothetical protein